MHAIEQILGNDIGWDGSTQRRSIIIERMYDTIVEVVIAHGLDVSFIEDQP